MKKCIALMAALVIASALAGCSDGAKKTDELESNLDIVPLLIDRQILTDAVWGEGTDIPETVACIAGSQFTLAEVVNPIMIAKTTTDSPLSEFPTVVTSSLNIYMTPDDADLRSETCPAGKLYFIVTASTETPIDVEVAGDTCPNLEEIATAEGVAFPQSGSAVAHFEAQEITVSIADLKKDEAAADETAEETVDATTDETTTDDDTATDPNTFKQKSFKLVIDECKAAAVAAE
jgi:hypothetical protein